jgi:hypothetical protein
MTAVEWIWLEVTDADISAAGANAIAQVVVNGAASGTTINATFAAGLEHANNIAVAAVCTNAGVVVAPDPDFAELGDDQEVTPNIGLETQWARGQVACDPTFAASISGISMLEVRAA